MQDLPKSERERLLRVRRVCIASFDLPTERDKDRMFTSVRTSFEVLYRAGYSEYEATKHAIFNHIKNEADNLVIEARSAVRISLISKYSILQK